ncbi:hypothetical protein C9374_014504 [Naegleria lovaniensis]|uniref:Disease resistance R13L4/SHOC-2-like LRR domain-containing protein n=1 Tax=Naegleria lovaniensis TaxID=51637 RepID=A0AA88H0L3_NAELO|nr:uncharacterized protein C9374_014504 [Naegleria lovaniensis]KAG2389104.1 hypothetical protein C9374_014504 [Naegleria lovaniensis]
MFDPLKNYNFDRMNNLVRKIGQDQEYLNSDANTASNILPQSFNDQNTTIVNLKFDEFLDNIEPLKPFLKNIETFIISHNGLNEEMVSEKVSPQELKVLSQRCTELDISCNNFSNILHGIWNFINDEGCVLRKLDAHSNRFAEWLVENPQNGTWLSKLEVLNLNSNRLTQFLPPSLSQCCGNNILSSLQFLDLSNNNMANLESLNTILMSGQLRSLKVLHMKKNKLSGVLKHVTTNNQHVCKNTSIEEIYLDDNQLEQVETSWICALPNLKILSLAFNKLKDVEILEPAHIEKIYLHSNEITTLDNMKGIFTDSLKVLSIHQNQINSLTDELGNCSTSLCEITLFNNKIQRLPPNLFQLTQIEALYLQNNELSEISEEIGNLQNLTELDLFNNKLTSIPSSIGKLVKMKRLCLDNNDLRTLPTDIINLTNLISFSFHGNSNLKVSPYLTMMATGL